MEVRIYKRPYAGVPAHLEMITRRATVSYTIDAYEPGAFSLDIPTPELFGYDIQEGDIVQIDGGDYTGIIMAMRFSASKDGDRATITGLDLRELLRRRNIVPSDYTSTDGTAGYDARTGPSETIIKGYIRDNLKAPVQPGRPAAGDLLIIAPDLGRGIADDKYMSRFEVLGEVATTIARDAELCTRMDLTEAEGEPLGFLFDCYQGVDRRDSQQANSYAIFEIERGNVVSMEFTDSAESYYNAFYTTRGGARFADEALTMLYLREDEPAPDWYDRREKWLNISVSKDVPAGDEYAELKRLAQQQMKNWGRVRSFTAKVNSALRFGADYNVGDKVSVVRRGWGVELDAQITRATISDQQGIVLTFGQDVPNVFKRIGLALKELK